MAPLPSTLAAAASLLITVASPLPSVEAFATPAPRFGRAVASASTSTSGFSLPSSSKRRLLWALNAEEGAEAEAEAPKEEASAEAEDEAEGIEEDEEEEEEEDPEVKEIKSKIAELESEIKRKSASLDEARDAADRYSEAGYMRKVAEMDQIRKLRGAAFKSNEFTARASALQNFLPVLDEFKNLDSKYSSDDFARSYSALGGTLSTAFSSLGASEYTAEVGSSIDVLRHEVVGEEYSDDLSEGTVLRPVSMGMDLEGNVMRQARVVKSLGSEEEARRRKAEEEEAARKKAEAEAEAKAEAEAEAGAEADAEGTEDE